MDDASQRMELRALREKMAQVRDVDVALHHYRQMLEDDEHNAYLYHNFGFIYHNYLNNSAKADYAYRKALTEDPNFATAHCNYGVLLGTVLNRPAEARDHFEAALRLDPHDAYAHACYALFHMHTGATHLAREQLGQALDADPTDTQALIVMSQFSAKHDGGSASAIPWLERAVAADPMSAHAYYLLGRAVEDNGDESRACELYSVVINIDTSFVEAHQRLAALYLRQGNIDGCKKHLVAVKNQNRSSFDARFRLAMFYIQHTNNYAAAAKHFQKALDLNPTSAICHNNLGLLQQMMGHYEAARDHYEEAIRLDSSYAMAHFNIGTLLERMSMFVEAREHYVTTTTLAPRDPRPLFNLASLLRDHFHQPRDAMSLLLSVIDISPKHVMAYVNLAGLYTSMGMIDQARDYLQRAIEIDPCCGIAHENLGTLLCSAFHEIEVAKDCFESALSLNPSDVELRIRLARLYLTSLANHSSALQHLQLCLADQNLSCDTAFTVASLATDCNAQFDSIHALLKQAMSRFPGEPRFERLLALLFYRHDVNLFAALQICTNILREHPNDHATASLDHQIHLRIEFKRD